MTTLGRSVVDKKVGFGWLSSIVLPKEKQLVLKTLKIEVEKISDHEKAVQSLEFFLKFLGLNLDDANYNRTPFRMVKAYSDLCRGLLPESKAELAELLDVRFPTRYKGMIIQDPITVYSLCSHHLLPVTYEISFGYIPHGHSLGFSKSVKAIELLAAKPISQEDLTQDIIETLNKALKPEGIGVVVKGVHECMKIRGSKSAAINVTSAVRGQFRKDQKTRDEFLTLAGYKK